MLTAFLLGINMEASAQKTQEVKIKTSAQCDMCKDRIESNIAFEKGVKDLYLDMESMELTVVYKTSKTDVNALRNAIANLGYDADDVKADPDVYKELPLCCHKPEDRGDVEHH